MFHSSISFLLQRVAYGLGLNSCLENVRLHSGVFFDTSQVDMALIRDKRPVACTVVSSSEPLVGFKSRLQKRAHVTTRFLS